MLLLFLSSGLFLGWFIGAIDAANLFGYAVNSKMVNFIKLSFFAGFFIILGAVCNGDATSETISNLGQINSPSSSFVIALAAGITIFALYKLHYQNSAVQAVVGAILGWILFTGHTTGLNSLGQIFTVWIISPILGGLFSALLYLFVKRLLKKLKIHVIILDTYIRIGIIISGAFAAFAFGANNVGGIMGLFLNSAPEIQLNFDFIQITGKQIIYFLGAFAISIGIITHKKSVFSDRNENFLTMMPETGIVLILSQALVFYIFSSKGLSNLFSSLGLFSIPAVPLSIYHVAVGSILGIGIVKGGHEFQYKTIGSIIGGIFSTIIIASIISFFLLFISKNILGISEIGNTLQNNSNISIVKQTSIHEINGVGIVWYLLVIITLTIIGIIASYLYRQRKLWQNASAKLNFERKEHNSALQALTEANLRAITLENSSLNNKLEFKHRELVSYALSIVEQQEYLTYIHSRLKEIQKIQDPTDIHYQINDLLISLKQKMRSTDQVESFYVKVEQLHQNFTKRLLDKFPEMSEKEQRLIKLLRLGFSSKEIAPLLNISLKSVEISRYRLRRKLKLDKEDNLIKFINNI
jgi:inorganic phosphate transporter, PiT family